MRELLPIFAVLVVAANAYSGALPTECPPNDLSDEVVHIPHEYDCAKFYKCVNGVKQLQTCSEYSGNRKLYFNAEKQICDWPWNVTCTLREPDCPAESDKEVLLAHPYDCSMYYQCKNGKIIVKCPEGQYFDSVRTMCVKKEEASCHLFWDTCPPSDFHIVARFPHESNCNEYYECKNAAMNLKQCPAGEAFDVNLRKCVFDEEARCDPALNPTLSSDCPSTGIENLPHEKECSLYYQCNDGVKTQKECPGGLSFNTAKGICSWPPSTTCSAIVDPPPFECPAKDSNEARRLPHECDCSIYYECYNGHMVPQHCPNGTEFDYIRQVCDEPEKSKCFNSVTKAVEKLVCSAYLMPYEPDCRYFYVCRNNNMQLGKCHEGYYYNDLIKSCDFHSGPNCRKPGLITTRTPSIATDDCPLCDCGINRFRHKLNCSLYYQCENGKKTVEECPDGLHFDPVKEICDYPDNVNCVIAKCVEGSNKTHECQCEKYYKCEGSQWVLQQCRNGWKFDIIDKVCKPEDEARCEIPIETGCGGKCPQYGHKIIPHENCTQYCECNDGKGSITNCIPNMYYNPAKQMCDWPENIKNLTCDPFPCPSNPLVPHECTCDLYYSCINGRRIREECPEGSEFNYESLECLKYEDAHCYKKPDEEVIIDSEKCLGSCPKLQPSDRSFTLPHRNCTKFCRCGVGAPYVVHCPPNLHFNEQTKRCVQPSLANCNPHLEYGYDERDLSMSTRENSFFKNILSEFF